MNYLKIEKEKLHPMVVELNTLLADYHIYYQNLKNFHWNVLGSNFFELHRKFEDLYNDANIKIDEIAERILTLHYHPTSKLSDYIKLSSIAEASAQKSDLEMVSCVLENQSRLLQQMYIVIDKAEKINDEGTKDLIGGYIRALEKQSWMLNAFLKSSNAQIIELISNHRN